MKLTRCILFFPPVKKLLRNLIAPLTSLYNLVYQGGGSGKSKALLTVRIMESARRLWYLITFSPRGFHSL